MTPDVGLFRKVFEQIDREPELWNQWTWAADQSCGTAYCVAGWALALSGHDVQVSPDRSRLSALVDGEVCYNGDMVRLGAEALGINPAEAEQLFMAMNSRERLQELAEKITGEKLR